MVRRQPLLQRGRQQQLLIRVVGKEGLAHRQQPQMVTRPIISSTAHQQCFSDGLLVVFDIQTGLRRSELLGLQWRDVNLSKGALSVQRALIKLPSGETELNTPKNIQVRVVDLPGESVELLNRIYQRKCKGPENGHFVFYRPYGSTLDPDQVTQTFKRIARKAGLAKFGFHDLRHTHASLMLSKGIHLKIVSERLGHSSIAITADLYSHVLPSVQRDAVSQFGSEWRKRIGKFR